MFPMRRWKQRQVQRNQRITRLELAAGFPSARLDRLIGFQPTDHGICDEAPEQAVPRRFFFAVNGHFRGRSSDSHIVDEAQRSQNDELFHSQSFLKKLMFARSMSNELGR